MVRELNSNLSIPQPKSVVGANLLQVWQSEGSHSGDLTLRFHSGDPIRCHKFVLACRSEKFKALLDGGFSESHQSEISIEEGDTASSTASAAASASAKRQKIDEDRSQRPENIAWTVAFRVFIEFLYSGKLDFDEDDRLKDSDVVTQLLRLSDQYLVPDLKECLEYWLQFSIEASNAAFLFSYADECEAQRLRSACLSYIVTYYDQCSSFDFWTLLSPELRSEIEANIQTRFRRRRGRSESAPNSQNSEDDPLNRKRKRK